MPGHGSVTDNWEEFSRLAWDDSFWTGREDARDILRDAVNSAVQHLATPEEKTAKAKSILSKVAGGLGLAKTILGL